MLNALSLNIIIIENMRITNGLTNKFCKNCLLKNNENDQGYFNDECILFRYSSCFPNSCFECELEKTNCELEKKYNHIEYTRSLDDLIEFKSKSMSC
jgi:hypothetical protein